MVVDEVMDKVPMDKAIVVAMEVESLLYPTPQQK
jgi:hypothetical protein